ncbi:MAG: hypothetical protein ACI8RZ_000845 [Myxococcota bacterium]|jgi:hypothetical protein
MVYTQSMNPYRAFLLSLLPTLIAGCDLKTDTQESSGCLEVEENAECPAADDVDLDALSGSCGSDVISVTGEGTYYENVGWGFEDSGTLAPGCCYPTEETEPECVYGRPLLIEGRARLAEVIQDTAWAAGLIPQDVPEAVREELILRWTRAALDEHASVAAFSKVALDLMRFGAPPELLERTHQAAIDEVRHARLGFALASAFAGQPIGPGAYTLDHLPLAADLIQVAVEAAREGCMGEALASLLAAEGAAKTQDPVLREVLETIAVDEQQHSLLAWSTVKWAIEVGGEPVREAVAAVFAAAATQGIAVPQAPSIDLSRWGLLSQTQSATVARRCLHEVVLPAARALIGAPISREITTRSRLGAEHTH